MVQRTRWWQLTEAEDGLGLIEVMLAIFILGVALAALASVGLTSLTSTRVSRDREQATNAASAAIEHARSLDFAELALAPGSVTVGLVGVPPDAVPAGSDETCFGDEPVVTDAVDDPITFEDTVGNGDHITIHTLVTYAEGTCETATTSRATSSLKRVIAIASWTDAGVVRTVRQETLVVAAGRGLPVPEFTLRPPQSSLTVSQAFLSDTSVTDKRRCVEHQVRNLGAEDSYEWELQAASNGSVVPLGNGYQGGDWLVTAHLEFPALESSRSGVPPGDDTSLMKPASKNGRPFSDLRVTPGETATLTVCYEPSVDALDPATNTWPTDVTTTLALHSMFDDRQLELIVHDVGTVDESAPGTPLRLFDPEDSIAHRRSTVAANGSLVYVPYVMGEQAPPGSDPSLVSNLGTIDYTNSDLSNWSTEEARSDPGVRFRQAVDGESREVGAATMAWHKQFLSPTVLLSDATLVLWHAPTSAFASTILEGEPVDLEIRVDGLSKNEKTVAWAGIEKTFSYIHTRTEGEGSWKRLEIPLDLGGDVVFDSDQYLRLRVTCAPANASDCNVAYDNVDHPSGVFVKVKS